MRVGIYARYSSDRQNPRSSEDQIRKCREYAQQNGWEVLDAHIYSDDAISGSRADRPAYQRLMKIVRDAEKSKHCPFDGILVEDNSRLWRDGAEQATAMKVFNAISVRVLGCDGLDTGSGSGNLLLTFKGAMAEEYLKELAVRTRRGLQSAALEGVHTGGRCFGYQNVPQPVNGNSKRRPSKLVIDPEQSEIVRRIFRMYADGLSLKAIPKILNTEKVASPRPARGRIQQSWCPSSIRTILHNERYRGVVVFGKTRKHKKSDDKRIARPGPEAEKVRKEFPDQRIVSDALWNRVQVRMAQISKKLAERDMREGPGTGSGNSIGNPYIFSGLLKCAECGANLTIVSGRGKNHGQPSYGCPMHVFRGTCSNSLRIKRDILESQLLQKIQTEVSREDVIRYALSRFEAELTRTVNAVTGQMGQLERRRKKLQKELANLISTIAEGLDSASVRSEIVEREREIQNINSQIVGAKPDSVKTKIQDARKFVEASLRDVRKLLGSGPASAKMTLARHMPSIVLKSSVRPDGRKFYKLNSEFELLEPGLALLSGAEGQNRTAYAGLFRAALYR
jgi:site-specific DNA recombinase